MKDCLPAKIARVLLRKTLGGPSNKEGAAELTRKKILLVAFEEMYEHGYQGMRIDHILAETKLAKGALYHHFSSKKVLAYAVIEEVLMASVSQIWQPLISSTDPIEDICQILKSQCEQTNDDSIAKGCPVNNLVQEMAGLDEGFNHRLNAIYRVWIEVLVVALDKGKEFGQVRTNVDTKAVSLFVVSAIQGILGTAKGMQSKPALLSMTATLCDYLEQLRVPPVAVN